MEQYTIGCDEPDSWRLVFFVSKCLFVFPILSLTRNRVFARKRQSGWKNSETVYEPNVK
jgi:hypothetical protein